MSTLIIINLIGIEEEDNTDGLVDDRVSSQIGDIRRRGSFKKKRRIRGNKTSTGQE